MISQTFAQALQSDHERLNAFLLEYQKMKNIDFGTAKDFFKRFKEGLEYHIGWEEDKLFPILEGKNASPVMPSLLDALLNEHTDIKK